jgi:hypothetical protein
MPWSDNDLTAIAGGSPASSSPFGYDTSLDGQGPCARVVYLSPDSHVHELSLVSGRNWADNDLTAIAGGSPASSSPVGYTTSISGEGPCARVVYGGAGDGHVHELSLVSGRNWADNDLTAIAGAPNPGGPFTPINLTAYTTGIDGEGPCARVAYVTGDGHVHELSLVSGRNWADNDLTAIAGGSVASLDMLTGYTTSIGGQGPCARVAYVSAGNGSDGHVHELSLVSGRNWADNDLTAIASGSRADSPLGYATSLDGQGPCARIVYLSPDRHVHELSLVA